MYLFFGTFKSEISKPFFRASFVLLISYVKQRSILWKDFFSVISNGQRRSKYTMGFVDDGLIMTILTKFYTNLKRATIQCKINTEEAFF